MKEAPFIRLVIPFICGIITEYHLNTGLRVIAILLGASAFLLLIFSRAALSFRFRYGWLYGVLLNVILFLFGTLVTSVNDSSEDLRKLEQLSSNGSPIIISIREPLSAKPKSWKALASVDNLSADILVYLKKDSSLINVNYGDRIAFIKPLSPIQNLPAFGTFDYKKYCALKNIHYQVFLRSDEYIVLDGKDISHLNVFLFTVRSWVLNTIKKYITGNKETGLAEALLIGYKDDVDKDLMKSYSDTGVIHVVAISGLHLGLIYVLLKYLCRPISSVHRITKTETIITYKFLTPLIIIAGLWVFSLLAGGSPSVLRSAVMFSFIVAGESFSRTTSVYNNLAASAFFLLCYNPYWLWDLGFQLSYFALLSIVIFQKPVYHVFIFKNKILDSIWKLNAVTISAQILTTPVCIFYFNQFPNLFLITNFIAVPVSSVILMGEILLCAICYFPVPAEVLGTILSYLIYFMNSAIEWLAGFSFSTTGGLHMNLGQLVTCYAFILFISIWLIRKDKFFIFPGLVSAILFFPLGALN